mmetsp:Transcript_4160/g.12963  ORF Transcript_4160/g.12963 Transcript_4160/m.12963 type:complete len:257 (+) Transcript_4160:170-940(+)
MGAGASQEIEAAELQECFRAFNEASDLSADAFEALVATHAPTVYGRAQQTGEAAAAAASLRQQFATAQAKLAAREAAKVHLEAGAAAAASAAQERAMLLRQQHSWAADQPANLQRGLVHGMLASHSVRLLTFQIGGESVVAIVDTGAERSALSPAAAKRCGLEHLLDPSFSRTVKGIGSAVGFGRVHYCCIAIASVDFHAAFDVFTWPEDVRFEGIIGLDMLVKASAIVDVAASELTLTSPEGQQVAVALRGETEP